jgi:hypothetical protein
MKTADVENMTVSELREIGAIGPNYTPSTEIGWRLVRLRAKYILSGGKLLTIDEINDEVAHRRGI